MTDRTAKTIALASARKGLRRRLRQFAQRLRDLPWLAVNYGGLFKRLKAMERYDGWATEFLYRAEEFKHIYRRFHISGSLGEFGGSSPGAVKLTKRYLCSLKRYVVRG